MNLMTISGNSGMSAAARGAPVKGVAGASASRTAAVARPKASAPVKPSISKGAEMLKELDQLRASDPDKLRAFAGDVARRLEADASTQGGAAGHALKQLAGRFNAVAKSGNLAALAPSQSARGGPRTGAAAYADNAKRGAMSIDVKQVVADVKRATDKSTTRTAPAAKEPKPPSPVQGSAAQAKSRAGGGTDNAERGAMGIDVRQVVADVKKATDKVARAGQQSEGKSASHAAAAQGKSRASGGADNADRGVMGIDIKQIVEDVKKATAQKAA